MNKKIIKKILSNKDLFKTIFAKKQLEVLNKYYNNKPLTKTEQSYLYKAIKNKLAALETLNQEFYITGNKMIKSRIIKAKQILNELNKEKAFISGSFLYKKNYQDIDIFIISNKRKQFEKGKHHYVYISESDLSKPIFQSALNYSISTFQTNIEPIVKKPKFNDLITSYELAINEILDYENNNRKLTDNTSENSKKTIRNLIFEYYLHNRKKVLNSYQLSKIVHRINKMSKDKEIAYINNITKRLLTKLYSPTYLYNELISFIKTLEQVNKEYKNSKNTEIYIDMLTGVKNACRRAKT